MATSKLSPAMLGVVALVAAGLGSFATTEASAAGHTLVSQGYPTSTSGGADDDRAEDAGEVDVSRSYDRPPIERETAELVQQREAAVTKNDRVIAARAAELVKKKERRAKLEKIRQAKLEKKRRNGWVMPVKGYTLTARFGQQSSLWSSGAHTGLDFAGPSGSKLVAMASGTVTSAGYSGAYGNRTVIKLADGTEVWYCHQSRIVVNVGDKVSPGEVIGYSGSTGNVTGPHLHLEVRPSGGSPVNPETVMRQHGLTP
ncbi:MULTISPECIES: M23 family metallopeptidase [Aeromicrobium]|uniref:M23 family metallopeptidase n=1 Tax=Aeromicrobium TaxID=2040 RepID=UPI001ABB430D|nr:MULTISPECIES: M23 family metallopeptidase [Aeromicrobium]